MALSGLSGRVVTLFLLLLAFTVRTEAAGPTDFNLPGEYYGRLDIVLPQSFASRNEALTRRSDRFELMRSFPTNHPIRKIGRSVGRLDIKYKDKNGIENTEFCTASIIKPARVLTNYHCIPGMEQ